LKEPSAISESRTTEFFGTLFLYIIIMAALSCGYSAGYQKQGKVASKSTFAVPIFENNTREPGVEYLFTEAFRRELSDDPHVRLVDRKDAEIVVTGVVAQVYSSPISFLQGGQLVSIGEYVLRATITLSAYSRDDGKVVYSGNFSGEDQYLSANEPVGTEANRRLALRRMAGKMVTDAHEIMMSGF